MGPLDGIQPYTPIGIGTRNDVNLDLLRPLPNTYLQRALELRDSAVLREAKTLQVRPLEPYTPVAVSPVEPTPARADVETAAMRREDESRLSAPQLSLPLDTAITPNVIDKSAAATTSESGPDRSASQDARSSPSLPYGPDPDRVRFLIDWFISRNQFLPVTFAYRQAGDLSDTVPTSPSAKPVVAVRAARNLYLTD